MIERLKDFWKQLKEYNKIANIAEIGRRYFAMNSFDGILTMLGVLIGSYLASVENPAIILSTGFAASIAMGVSGMWGTYLTEDAERKKKIRELSRATLNKKLKETKIGRAERAASLIVSFIDGIAPFLAASIVMSPFLLAGAIGITSAYYAAVVIAFLLLMLLGGFLGHISKENPLIWGLKMACAGIICVILIFLLGTG